MSLAQSKTDLKVFMNTSKPMANMFANLGHVVSDKSYKLKSETWLRPFVNISPEVRPVRRDTSAYILWI